MLNYELYSKGGFTPASVAPQCDNHASTTSSSLSAGAVWEDRPYPLLHLYQHLEFQINGKGILQSQNLMELSSEPDRQNWTYAIIRNALHRCLARLYQVSGQVIDQGRSGFGTTLNTLSSNLLPTTGIMVDTSWRRKHSISYYPGMSL
jgi:hypothetical protein